jgi:hypothetical protein
MNMPPRKNERAFAWPSTLVGMACCACVCATIAFLAYLVAAPHSQPPRRLWLPVVLDNNGTRTVLPETRQLEFWTPSSKTKDYLAKPGAEVAATEKWQVLPSEDPVLQFGTLLRSSPNVLGYRRVEIWGQGRSKFKPGWWWTLSVLTNFSLGDLTKAYHEHWKSQQSLYVEVIDNRGSNDDQ